MSDSIEQRNILTLHEVIKEQRTKINDLITGQQTLSNNLAILQADLQNTKQMIAVLKGIGMGSTVHN
jgi:plasmid maintenance system antidote protein VapI